MNIKKALATTIFLVLALMPLILMEPSSAQVPLPTVIIRADGTVSPSTAPISQIGNTYTFTDNLYAAIKIQKSNIVLDGAGYTLSGPYNGTTANIWVVGEGQKQLTNGSYAQYVIGIDLASASTEGVTIENLNVKNFSIGMYIWTRNNTITANAVSDNIVGILLSGSNQTVTKNYIADNQRGLFFGFNNEGDIIPSDIIIDHNYFENNIVQLNGCECKNYNSTETPHRWDDGKEGNFWSNYNGTDANGDGVGDSAYIIDVLNLDRYPLMESPVKLPSPKTKIPVEAIILGVSTSIALVAGLLIYQKNHKRNLVKKV